MLRTTKDCQAWRAEQRQLTGLGWVVLALAPTWLGSTCAEAARRGGLDGVVYGLTAVAFATIAAGCLLYALNGLRGN